MFNKILISLGIGFLRLASWLPMPLTRLFGTVMGLIAYKLMSKRRHIGMVNLNLCFPQKSLVEKQKILRQHFAELFITGLNYGLMFGASENRIRRLIKYRGMENLQQYYKKQPVVLLAPHFLGLDLGAHRSTMDISGYTIFSQQRNAYLSRRIKQARMRFSRLNGGDVFSRQEGIRKIVKKLKQNKFVFYYLPDQDMDEKSSVYVPFFAHPNCATLDTLPKLLKLSNAVVMPMATYREGNSYVVEFTPVWENYPSGDLEVDVAFMNRQIEVMINNHPSQYLWIHKRFKTQPNLPRGKLYESC